VLQIDDAHALASAVGGLMRDPERSGEMAAAVKRIAVSGGAVLDHIMEILAPFTAPLVGTKGRGKNEKNGESDGGVTTAAETSCART